MGTRIAKRLPFLIGGFVLLVGLAALIQHCSGRSFVTWSQRYLDLTAIVVSVLFAAVAVVFVAHAVRSLTGKNRRDGRP